MFDLQLFNDPIKGSRIIYLYRVLEDAATSAASAMMFATEDGLTMSKDADTTATKDGSIRTPGAIEIEKSGTSILAKNDTLYPKLKSAMKDDKIIEIWRANLDEPKEGGTNQFKGTYYQGYLTEFEETANAEDFVEISTTFAINGSGVDGDVTVSTAQQEAASYVFKDTTQASASES